MLAFHDILGQDRARTVIERAVRCERVHHAWIFFGPRGVGKFTTARALATILLDPDARPGADPACPGALAADPRGRTAQLVEASTHPDLHVIRKELALFSENPQLRNRKLSNIPLDVLREHMIGGKTSDDRNHDAAAYRTAALGHGKVFIIDEAEMIDRFGQNALLKTLEEPPERTYLVLITDRLERLLPTIRSRCQHVCFGPLPPADMQAWFDRSRLDVGPEECDWILAFADGSPGVAEVAARYGFHRWQRELDSMVGELERGGYPVRMGATLAEWVESFATEWVKHNANASKDAANKDGARYLITVLGAMARRRLAAPGADEATLDRWLSLIDLLRRTEGELQSNVNMKQSLENLVVQWGRVAAPAGA